MFQPKYCSPGPSVNQAVEKYLECGVLESGFARVVCDTCKEEFLVGLLTESVVENMLSWPHSDFHVHLGPVIHGDDKEQLKATARYSARAGPFAGAACQSLQEHFWLKVK